jgi:membrane fusion protein, heavy metal efflux system
MFNKSILFVASMLVVTLCSCNDNKKKEETATAFVLSDVMLSTTQTAPAKTVPLKNELSFYGKITADNNKLIEIYPIVGGNVMKVNVELGDYVTKGQVLASIRSTEVASFEKDLIDAKNDVLVAKNSVKVAQELFEGKLNSDRDVLEAKSQLEKAESQLHRINEVYSIL